VSDTAPTEAPSSHSAGPCRRVLLVDDNKDVVRALSRLIRLLGHQVKVASDGEEALLAADEFCPNVVLMDIGLPKLNGYDAARAMRVRPWRKEAVLVAITGWGQDHDRLRSSDAGFDEHLTKPVELAQLRELLSQRPRATEAESPRSGENEQDGETGRSSGPR